MASVYILQSLSDGKFYVGATADLRRRVSEHQRKHSPDTRGRGPWKLVYQEEFGDLSEARRREREIKSWKSHRRIEELLKDRLGALSFRYVDRF